jgi:ATP-dependent DNA helicase PIF1
MDENIFKKYAQHLPLEIKIKILINLPYDNIRFITDPYFWTKYWEHYNNNNIFKEGLFKPNPEQRYVLGLIEQGKNIFINAPAGTGKSALVKYFFQTHQSHKLVGLTSTTGISALNIGGSTLHSFLGIGLGRENVEDLYDKILKNKYKLNLWLNLNILIIDEVSMLNPSLFDKLEKLARKLRENKMRFGGIQLVVIGDLFQLPCVSENSALIINSSRFRKCIDVTIEMRNIVRQNDPIFKNILNKIRVGIVDTHVKQVLKTRFQKPSHITDRSSINRDTLSQQGQTDPAIQQVEDLLKRMRKAHPMRDDASQKLIIPTKLFCTRKSVNDINERELNKLALQGFEFREYVMEFVSQDCPVSFAYVCEHFGKHSTTPTTLQICEQAQVMLTYNISSTLVNGSRGIITGFTTENYPIVEFLNNSVIVVKPIKFSLYHTLYNGKVKLVGYAIQIPLKIAYALTIHSSQGSTLDWVSIDLNEAFEYGQAYTALSRAKTLDGLFIKKFDFGKIRAHPEALQYSITNEK